MKGVQTALGTVPLGLALLTTAAQAQSPPSTPTTWNVGVGLSMLSPSGYDTGFNAHLSAVRLANAPVWIRPEWAWDHFRHLNFLATVIDAGHTFKTTGEVGPYLFGGPQYTFADLGTENSTQSSFSANVGGGLTFPLARRIGYLEIRYVWVGTLYTKHFEAIPVTVGIRF